MILVTRKGWGDPRKEEEELKNLTEKGYKATDSNSTQYALISFKNHK